MKYLLLIGDGMGDWSLEVLGGKTPLEFAETPNLDYMAKNGTLGLARTVPEGMTPGSDVAIMSLMGFNPQGVLTGRGPLEAASLGVDMTDQDLAFRFNLVTVEHQGDQVIMRNHAAGNIPTEEGEELVKALASELPLAAGQHLHPGVSYRHLMIWPDREMMAMPSYPPHDYRDKDVTALLNDPQAKPIMDLVKASWDILTNHPINKKRREAGLLEANSIWLWGQGLKPAVKSYQERWGISGATVSAVDLIKGLGVATGLKSINVPGATGWVDTDYEGKVAATLKSLEENGDFVVVHLEAPDEASHQGELDMKLKAISDFDTKVVGPLLKALPSLGSFRIIAACDHYTPVEIKTHVGTPIPFILYESPASDRKPSGLTYSEANAAATGVMVDPGAGLGELLFGPEK